MEIYLSEGTRIVTVNDELNEQEEVTSMVKILGSEFFCLGAVMTSWGNREITLKLTKGDKSTEQLKGYIYNECVLPDEENLFAMDLSGHMLPVHIIEKKVEFGTYKLYNVELPETYCHCEAYVYISGGVYRRLGSRSNIINRKVDQLMSSLRSD